MQQAESGVEVRTLWPEPERINGIRTTNAGQRGVGQNLWHVANSRENQPVVSWNVPPLSCSSVIWLAWAGRAATVLDIATQ